MHPGLATNVPLRRLDPLVRPSLQRLAAQKPHFLDQPLLGGVRLSEIAVQVPHRADYRRQSVAKMRMRLAKRPRLILDFGVARWHGSHDRETRLVW